MTLPPLLTLSWGTMGSIVTISSRVRRSLSSLFRVEMMCAGSTERLGSRETSASRPLSLGDDAIPRRIKEMQQDTREGHGHSDGALCGGPAPQ